MGKMTRMGVLGAVVVAGTLAFSGGLAMAAPPSSAGTAYTCSGGSYPNDFVDIQSGTYSSLTVAGVCDVPDNAVVNVTGNINVLSGAALDAEAAPSTITVGHNVTAADGSVLGLGCQPDGVHAGHACMVDPTGSSLVTVDGNISTTNAYAVLLNGITVDGNVTLSGGGSGYNAGIPWTVKNDTIKGNLSVSGLVTDWIGVLFNNISGNANLTNITVTDPTDPFGPPTMQIALNTVGKNLNCSGIGPQVSGGFAPGEVNTVGGKATGQCANLQSGL
jgi:hypothetical protein